MKKPTKKQIASFTATIVRAKLKDENVDIYTALLKLYKIGVTYIDAEFSGSGDSGDLHEICYYPSEVRPHTMTKLILAILKQRSLETGSTTYSNPMSPAIGITTMAAGGMCSSNCLPWM